jgi:diguanylate cyclase (GGDEF)-like protein/PAS domain S-box-containing protein
MDEQDLNKERLELALEAAGLDLWENNLLTGQVTRQAMKTFLELGYDMQEVPSLVANVLQLVHPDDVEPTQRTLTDLMAGKIHEYRNELRLQSKSGEWVWFANYGRIMDTDSATPGQRFIGVTFNIDDRKRRENEIAEINRQLAEQNSLLQNLNAALELLAATDALTGLANRRTLMELGTKECKRSQRFEHALSVLMVDIDSFKNVNDNWGHLIGDRVICAVADVCRLRVRGNLDTVARLGGEEFVVLLPETSGTHAETVAEALRAEVAEQQVVSDNGKHVAFTVSIGVASLTDGLTFEQLLNHADKALYQAKQQGRNQVMRFEAIE